MNDKAKPATNPIIKDEDTKMNEVLKVITKQYPGRTFVCAMAHHDTPTTINIEIISNITEKEKTAKFLKNILTQIKGD